MKMKLQVVLILALVGALTIAPTLAVARGDKDCSDFPSQRAAQLFFVNLLGPARLLVLLTPTD